MPGRIEPPAGAVNRYKYGFNGKENDKETVGTGEGTQDYGFRIYNPSLGKFLSVDPLTKSYPSWSPYPFAMNRPIDGVDLDGEEWKSNKSWNDIINGKSYSELWTIQVSNILNGYVKSGLKDDCANVIFSAMIDFSSQYGLPFHLEGSNTGALRLFDNDLNNYKTVEQLKTVVVLFFSKSITFPPHNFADLLRISRELPLKYLANAFPLLLYKNFAALANSFPGPGV